MTNTSLSTCTFPSTFKGAQVTQEALPQSNWSEKLSLGLHFTVPVEDHWKISFEAVHQDPVRKPIWSQEWLFHWIWTFVYDFFFVKAVAHILVLILLDLLAIFDIDDHHILHSILSGIGIDGNVFFWCGSYISRPSFRLLWQGRLFAAHLAGVIFRSVFNHQQWGPSYL